MQVLLDSDLTPLMQSVRKYQLNSNWLKFLRQCNFTVKGKSVFICLFTYFSKQNLLQL